MAWAATAVSASRILARSPAYPIAARLRAEPAAAATTPAREGTGIYDSGAITSLTNSSTIAGGAGGHGGAGDGATGNAIYNVSGQGSVPVSIGSITNTGQIIGNVDIEDQANLNVYGGTGATFGSWSGGTITIGGGNLTFAGGNTALADNIEVYGGSGTVFNDDPLQISSPLTITGDFNQDSKGVLDLDFASSHRLRGANGHQPRDARRWRRDRPYRRLHADDWRKFRHP